MAKRIFKLSSELAALVAAALVVLVALFSMPASAQADEGGGGTGSQSFEFVMNTVVKYDTLFVLVQSEEGVPLQGATVSVDGFGETWITDAAGKASVKPLDAGAVLLLRIACAGYQEAEASYTYQGVLNRETFAVTLKTNLPDPPGPVPGPGPNDGNDIWARLPLLGDMARAALPWAAAIAAIAGGILIFIVLKRRKKADETEEG